MLADSLVSILLSISLIGAYSLMAIGIVSIYRASRVLNLAHGTMAMVPAYVVFTLSRWGVPLIGSLVLGIAAGTGLGWLVERVFVRPLRGESETSQTVGTVAALGVILALSVRAWGATPQAAVKIFPDGGVSVGDSTVRHGELGLFAVMLVAAGALFAVFRYTDLGLVMRGTAENRTAAALMGADPQKATNIAWMLGGGLAGLAGILLAGITNLDPFTLSLQSLPAFVAALIGGLGSFVGAVAGGAVVGLAFGFVPQLPVIGEMTGGPQFVLAVVAIVAMAARGARLAGADLKG